MEIVLLWCFVLAYFAKRGAEDLVHAVKGTPNPRYELKRERARAAGQASPSQPRYGTREWFADLYSDALVAHTEKRRRAAAAKAQPVDDMVEVVREPRRDRQPAPYQPVGDIGGEDWCEQHRMPRMRQGVTERGPRSRFCPCPPRVEFVPPETPEDEGLHDRIAEAEKQQNAEVEPDTRPLAPVINLFPNINQFEKEITMANTEVTSLVTAMAYAELAATAHQSFATAGAEPYVASLENAGMTGEAVGSARAAAEASANAAAMWEAHRALLEQQMQVKEAYQSQPDAADKEFLLNG